MTADASKDASGTSSMHRSPPLTEAEVLQRFDSLVGSGLVKYDYSFATQMREVGGLQFEFRISKALTTKPANPGAARSSDHAGLEGRPGSDINTQGAEMAALGGTHFLAFNGFSSYRPHFLLLTQDGHRRQRESLDIDDFRAVCAFVDALGSDYLFFFNCGTEAGCSRVHKHMQAIPRESFSGKPWHNLDVNQEAIPFAHFERALKGDAAPEEMLKVYRTGLETVERALGRTTTAEEGAPAHNLIMDRDRMVLIPRRAAGIEPVGTNAGGMLGMIWTHSEEWVDTWLRLGPHKVLEAGGVSKNA